MKISLNTLLNEAVVDNLNISKLDKAILKAFHLLRSEKNYSPSGKEFDFNLLKSSFVINPDKYILCAIVAFDVKVCSSNNFSLMIFLFQVKHPSLLVVVHFLHPKRIQISKSQSLELKTF